jgi:hypothetical protein
LFSASSGGCDPGNYRCQSGDKCIPASWICDNENDCDDGDDEQTCCTSFFIFFCNRSKQLVDDVKRSNSNEACYDSISLLVAYFEAKWSKSR